MGGGRETARSAQILRKGRDGKEMPCSKRALGFEAQAVARRRAKGIRKFADHSDAFGKDSLKAFYTPQECHVWRVRGAPAGEGDPDVKHVLRFCLEREET